MNKSSFVKIFALCLCMFLLAGCGNAAKIKTNDNSNRPETPADMTGFPTGTIQRECLYVNGSLYLYNSRWNDNLQDNGYTYYGEIKEEDVYNTPNLDLTAAWIEVGSKVYVCSENAESVIVEENGLLYKYTADALQ